ncbi:MAG: hypothetical protein V9F82_01640 [Dermatophilaceae bacterium]
MTGPGADTRALLDALAGRFDRWRWTAGLTAQVVAAATGIPMSPRPTRLGERTVGSVSVAIPPQPYAVRLRWEIDGELALVELSAPAADPDWPTVLAALGEPDLVHPPGRGPFPGSAQRCHLSRGVTVFDGAGLGYQAVWLYPPMSAQEYAARTAPWQTPTRVRR